MTKQNSDELIFDIHLHAMAQLATLWEYCLITPIEKFGTQLLQLSFMTIFFIGLWEGAINIKEISPCYITQQN